MNAVTLLFFAKKYLERRKKIISKAIDGAFLINNEITQQQYAKRKAL